MTSADPVWAAAEKPRINLPHIGLSLAQNADEQKQSSPSSALLEPNRYVPQKWPPRARNVLIKGKRLIFKTIKNEKW